MMVWYKCGSAFYINLNALDVNKKKIKEKSCLISEIDLPVKFSFISPNCCM